MKAPRPEGRRHDPQRAGMGLCQDWHLLLFVPTQAGALGVAYALDGRVAAGLALVEQGRAGAPEERL
jgi:hypothetical protein